MIALRPYQADAVERVREAIRQGSRRIVLCAPTGSGKTVIAAHLAQSAIARGSKVLIAAHREELVKQPFCRFVEAGIDPGQIGVIKAGVGSAPTSMLGPGELDDAGLWAAYARRRPGAPVQVASIQTLANRHLGPWRPDLILVDEAHRILSKSYIELLARFPDAIVIGLTATPTRSDRRGLGEVFGAIVVVAQYRELVAMGALVEPTVLTVGRLPDLSAVRLKGGDYDPTQLAAAVNRTELVGDIVDHWQRRAGGAPTIVFAASVPHSQRIAAAFVEAGVAAVHVDANTPAEERAGAWAKLASGEVRVVVNCEIAIEGVDVPCVKCIVLARPTKSIRIYLQSVGRGSRPFPGGHRFVVLDHAGCFSEPGFGLPQEDREWSLEPPARKRRNAESVPPTKVCKCYAVVPSATRVCPECGYEFPAVERGEVKETAGELVEVTDELRVSSVIVEWHKANLGREVPYHPNWCLTRYQKRFAAAWPAGIPLPSWTPSQALARAEFDARGGDRAAHVAMAIRRKRREQRVGAA